MSSVSAVTTLAESTTDPAATRLTRARVDSEQLVERYLTGQLALRSKLDLEQFCRDNPKFVDEIALSTRVHASLKLIDVAGKPEPWNEQQAWFWTSHWFAGAATILLFAAAVFGWQNSQLAAQTQRQLDQALVVIKDRPLVAAGSSRTVSILPAENPPLRSPMLSIGDRGTEFVTLNFDLKRHAQDLYTLEIERIDQGRVARIRNLRRDSNGMISWSINSSALGPGLYVVRITGVSWRGQASDVGGASFEIVAPRV